MVLPRCRQDVDDDKHDDDNNNNNNNNDNDHDDGGGRRPADQESDPGAYNKVVRQKTIDKTICVKGWTKTVRPSVSYTNALKIKQMGQYGETGSPSAYEEDHFIPLELGGAPKNPKNLWPEPHSQSKKSDTFETQLKRKVCKGLMKLAKARAQIRAFKFENG